MFNGQYLGEYCSDPNKIQFKLHVSSRRMHLRLRERVGNGFGAASPNPVATETEAGQRPVEQIGTKVVMIQKAITQSVLLGFK